MSGFVVSIHQDYPTDQVVGTKWAAMQQPPRTQSIFTHGLCQNVHLILWLTVWGANDEQRARKERWRKALQVFLINCTVIYYFLSFISKWESEGGEFGFVFFFWLSGMNQQMNLIYKVNFTDACCSDWNKLPLFILRKEFDTFLLFCNAVLKTIQPFRCYPFILSP